MQTLEEKYFSDTAEKLKVIHYGLMGQKAWHYSKSYIINYLNEHPPEGKKYWSNGERVGGDEPTLTLEMTATALLAAGRLDWLLQATRHSLSGLFSENDIETLLDCYQGDIFFPKQLNTIASELCDHLGVEVEDYPTSYIAPLIDKLLGLDSVQRVTLADALEQAWHRGMKQEELFPKDFFATLGIDLT